MYDKIVNNLKNSIKRAYVSHVIKDDKPVSLSQIKYYDCEADAENIYPYGLQSVAPKETFCLVFNVNGQSENLAVIPYCQAERFDKLKEGEVKVGSPKHLIYLYFKEDGSVELKANGDLNIACKNMNINATEDLNISCQNANIDATQTNLGSGGQPIARLHDAVNVGGVAGTITGASTNNTSI